MRVLIITDIFGCNESVSTLEADLRQRNNTEVLTVDPYQRKNMDFDNDELAYQHYIKVCGHDKYYTLAKETAAQYKPDVVLGFSAGGSVAWRLSDNNQLSAGCIICFYPSQIRHHLTLQPVKPTNVVFAASEGSFNVKDVAQKINESVHVDAQVLPYEHGFMNRASKNFAPKGYELGMKIIFSHLAQK